MKRICHFCGRFRPLCEAFSKFCSDVLHLIFLPPQCRKWLFGTGTRLLEFVNIGCLLAWAFAAWQWRFAALPSYAGISRLPRSVALAAFVGSALLIAVALWLDKCKSGQRLKVGGLALTAAAMVWTLLSVSMWVQYETVGQLTPMMFIYPFLAVLSWLGGQNLLDEMRKNRRLERG